MKVYLIGMPGSGKSTLGKQLAEALKVSFVDLDVEIEKREGDSIKEIFQKKGEDYFRKVESGTLEQWARQPGSFVMATGGGAPCFFNGMATINETGVSIFLDVPVPELINRLEQDQQRPLLQQSQPSDRTQKLESIYTGRIAIYRQAHLTVDGQSVTPEDVLKKMDAIRK